MSFLKLFFYCALVSLTSLTNTHAAAQEVLIKDGQGPLVYADGSLGSARGVALRLKVMWKRAQDDLAEEITAAATPAERLAILRNHKGLIRKLDGVSSNFNNLIRPAVAPKPTKGTPARAELNRRGLPAGLDMGEDLEDKYDSRADRAATSIQSAWRGMKARRDAAERSRKMGQEKHYKLHKQNLERARLRAQIAAGRYKQAAQGRLEQSDGYRLMFDQADELLAEERSQKRKMEHARLRAKIAQRRYEQADRHHLMFEQADSLLREEADRRFGTEYSEAKRDWQSSHQGEKKNFWESEKKFQTRLYNQMLNDLESSFPEQVAAEREMREAR